MSSITSSDSEQKVALLQTIKHHKNKLFIVAALAILAIGSLAFVNMQNDADMATCNLTSIPCGSTPGKCNMGSAGGGQQCLYNQDYNGHAKCTPCS